MPTVFRHNGFRFYFFSDEGSPREPLHIHVKRGDDEAKLWIGKDDVSIAYNFGFDRRTLAMLVMVTRARRGEIGRAWNGHFA